MLTSALVEYFSVQFVKSAVLNVQHLGRLECLVGLPAPKHCTASKDMTLSRERCL